MLTRTDTEVTRAQLEDLDAKAATYAFVGGPALRGEPRARCCDRLASPTTSF